MDMPLSWSYAEGLTFTTLWANSADDKLIIVSYFFEKTAFDFQVNFLHW